MIVWVIFGIQVLILIISGLKKGFLKNLVSFILNIISSVISFFVARLVVNSMAVKSGEELVRVIFNEYSADFNNISAFEEFAKFGVSIIIGIAIFYMVYFLASIIMFILKHAFIYDKVDNYYENRETNSGLDKIANVIISLLSASLTFIILFTPIGIVYNISSKTVFDGNVKELPLVSEKLFDKLTEIPDNKNDIKSSEEINYILETALSIYKFKDGNGDTEEVKESFSKSYFLPTIIGETGSEAAKHWKNGEEFLSYQHDVPDGREGKLYLSALGILEKWNKKVVVEDVGTILDIYKLMDDYGLEKLKEKDGLLDALSQEEFTEELFIELYSNNDFVQLVPVVVEYGLGTAFDYVEIDLDENYVSKVDVSKLSEEDVRREARIVSGIIRTILDVYRTNEKLQNGQLNAQDIQRIIEEISKLKDSKVLGDIANEFVLQLRNSIPNIQF